MKCKYCHSENITKYGTFKGVQRWWCKDCKRKFADNRALPKMKTSVSIIGAAVGMYFGGMPLDSIQRQLYQDYGVYYSEAGIYKWVVRFAKEAIDKAKSFKPTVGDTWIADETVIKVKGKNIWFWDIIDADSRYLLASRLSTTRTTKDAALLMKQAQMRAGKAPKRVMTDKLRAYLDGIELVFGAKTLHIQSSPFDKKDSTRLIERFHGTFKDRINVVRGFKNMDMARLLTDGWLIHYNFFKEHEALGNIPPAQKMGNVPFKDWEDVVRNTKVVTAKGRGGEAKQATIYHKKRKPKYPEPEKLLYQEFS